MKNKIDMRQLFNALDEEMMLKLSSKIDEISHPVSKGDEAELNWIGLLRAYLPERYSVDSGFIIDYEGTISDQIDVIIYDRHFTPFIFRGEKTLYIPAEGVYAIFEIKPHFDKTYFEYAVNKLESVKKLKRTTAPFVHILGTSTKKVENIMGGILTKENKSASFFDGIDNKSPLSFIVCLDKGVKLVINSRLVKQEKDTLLAFFLLKLIEKLRVVGSVPAIDVDKYLTSIQKK